MRPSQSDDRSVSRLQRNALPPEYKEWFSILKDLIRVHTRVVKHFGEARADDLRTLVEGLVEDLAETLNPQTVDDARVLPELLQEPALHVLLRRYEDAVNERLGLDPRYDGQPGEPGYDKDKVPFCFDSINGILYDQPEVAARILSDPAVRTAGDLFWWFEDRKRELLPDLDWDAVEWSDKEESLKALRGVL